jgi:protein-L-isoaspartate(D-aspartate) O-methyltransferase
MMKNLDFTKLRQVMVQEQIVRRGIANPDVIKAFLKVPRHLFVPGAEMNVAYEDYPLSVGLGQTISQPYIVALMTQALNITRNDKILEIGTGSGYQTAILAELGARIFSIERIPSLAQLANDILTSLGYHATIHVGDGTCGWQDHAPYDRIIITAAAPAIAFVWVEQLNVGGKIIVPVGGRFNQELIIADKVSATQTKSEVLCGCTFVPLIGRYGFKE